MMKSTLLKKQGLFITVLIMVTLEVFAQKGFISLDCGGTRNYTDSRGINWTSDLYYISSGLTANTTGMNDRQYQTVRFFNERHPKYCYTLPVTVGRRYLVRATFFYGNFDNSGSFPSFQISIDATTWATIQINNATKLYFQEIIVSAQKNNIISVCVFGATAGIPFISTLELRQMQASMYAKSYDSTSYLRYAQRINYGAPNEDVVRYPDDPVDRFWESDIALKGVTLTNEAPGTVRISTQRNISNMFQEIPPQKVMQTAVVGTQGLLSYRLALPTFPASAWAKTFLAEIQDLNATETRRFTFFLQNDTKYNNQSVNLESDFGPYNVYEAGFDSLSLPELVNFEFRETDGSSLGPILNAMEILQLVPITGGTSSLDAAVVMEFKTKNTKAAWALEGGDPCLPVSWDWLKCDSASVPRVTAVVLSSENLTGLIPSDISEMTSLVDLYLDNNSLSGLIPDLSQLSNLTRLHLENNNLNGSFPQYFADLANLQELFVQNNQLWGTIPRALLTRPGLDFKYSGNPNLKLGSSNGSHWKLITGIVVAGSVIVAAASTALYFFVVRKYGRRPLSEKEPDSDKHMCLSEIAPSQTSLPPQVSPMPSIKETGVTDPARCFSFTELKDATENFSMNIGQGGFGSVYYGKLKDSREIAVKVLSAESHQGNREFLNEVNLLSRIHHRNLVSFYGYCEEQDERMLVYEYMHKGTLRDLLHGKSSREYQENWTIRLEISLDAAKGLEYLHTGCSPSIIHRDVKSSNILIDSNMKAKVSDFGLSKGVTEGATHVSSTVRGTVGYLDPQYYLSQQLTEKSDVYSFGVVLLEVISGKEPISTEHFGSEHNIVQWARSCLQKGDIYSMIDPNLGANYSIESIWKAAEVAIQCVEPYGYSRPNMSDIVQELKQAIQLEKNSGLDETLEAESRPSRHSSISSSPTSTQIYGSSELPPLIIFSDSTVQPSVR